MIAFKISRRSIIVGAGALTVLPTFGARGAVREFHLRAAPGRVRIVGAEHPETDVWCYAGRVPGPEIRVKQGDRLRVVVENGLAEETTVHWHGIRLPNAMDGVPHLTQPPIAPGGRFTYEFDLPDAGTYWYHPHARSFEQVGRGLAGALIVEERTAPAFDRELIWVLGDWRMTKDAEIVGDFGNLMDMSHAGRLGNTITLSGRLPEDVAVRAGERIRLRLINVASARILALEFKEHEPSVIALDGHPIEPHAPDGGRVVIGPASRVDLALDCIGAPGGHYAVRDRFDGPAIQMLDLKYAEGAPLRSAPPAESAALPANPLSEPDLAQADRHEIVLGGGMMGGMREAIVDGRTVGMREMLMQLKLAWAINGVAASEHHAHQPMLTLAHNRSVVLDIRNETAWPHPMHLHGHAFRVLTRNGTPTRYREWLDTVLIMPRERAEIAFVADNPGDWMLHCHILEHQAGGMGAVIRVA